MSDARLERAGFWTRAAAAAVDAAIGVGLSLLLAPTLGMFFARRAVVTLRIGEPDTWWQGPVPMMLGAVGEVVYLLPCVLLITWMLDPLTGATAGKRLFRLRVRGADGRLAPPSRRWRRSLIQTVGFWGCTLALLVGSWQLALAAVLAGAVIFAGSLGALGSESLALHDRASGTSVCRRLR